MVLSLWGLMMFQFLEDDGGVEGPKMQWISKKYEKPAFRETLVPEEKRIPLEQLFPPKPPEDLISQPAATVTNM